MGEPWSVTTHGTESNPHHNCQQDWVTVSVIVPHPPPLKPRGATWDCLSPTQGLFPWKGWDFTKARDFGVEKTNKVIGEEVVEVPESKPGWEYYPQDPLLVWVSTFRNLSFLKFKKNFKWTTTLVSFLFYCKFFRKLPWQFRIKYNCIYPNTLHLAKYNCISHSLGDWVDRITESLVPPYSICVPVKWGPQPAKYMTAWSSGMH